MGALFNKFNLKTHSKFMKFIGKVRNINSPEILIFLFAIFAQIVTLIAIPIGFECDAGMFLNYAKKISFQNGVYTDGRPPLYPLFLLVTGVVYPGTLIITVLAQSIIGVAMPIILYKTAEPYGRKISFIGSLLLIITFVPFVGSKLFLAEQLYSCLLLLAIYFLKKSLDSEGNQMKFGIFLLFAIAATMTRFEGQLILFFGSGLLIVVLLGKRNYRDGILIGLVVISFVFGYSIFRSLMMKDFTLIGHLHNGFGPQIFWRVYNLTVDDNGKKVTILSTNNGPEIKRLSNILEVALIRNPEYYRSIRNGFDDVDKVEKKMKGTTYHELYGRWDGRGEDLVAHMLNSDRTLLSSNYSVFIPSVLAREIGVVKADKLLKNVSLEAIKAYPLQVFLQALRIESLFFGVNLGHLYDGLNAKLHDLQFWQADSLQNNALVSSGKEPRFRFLGIADFLRNIFFVQNDFAYSRTGFNAGDCAEKMMSKNMWNEYVFDKKMTDTNFSNEFISLVAIARSYVRILCGIILIVGAPLIAYRTRSTFFNILIFLVFIISTVVVVISSAGPGSKYDIPIFPVFILLTLIVISNLCTFIKK